MVAHPTGKTSWRTCCYTGARFPARQDVAEPVQTGKTGPFSTKYYHRRSFSLGLPEEPSVPSRSLVSLTLAALLEAVPALADRMAAKQADRQQYDEPPRDPTGALFAPSESGRVRGSGGRTE